MITKRDGSTVTGMAPEFPPQQEGTYLTTGVAYEDIQTVTVNATGRVGVPGSCVITPAR